jgi:hypothetical protein
LLFKYSFNKSPLVGETVCPPSPPPAPPTIKVLEEDLPFLSTNDYRYILTIPDYYTILVTPPKEKERPVIIPVTKRIRAIDFINQPRFKSEELNTNICGLSANELDYMVMVDVTDSQAYIIDQLGQLRLKINLEIFSENNKTVAFSTGGDFTGYQYNRKYNKNRNSELRWIYQLQTTTVNENKFISEETDFLKADVSSLTSGWHHICFVISLDQKNQIAASYFYVDSILKDYKLYPQINLTQKKSIYYKYRTSFILGAVTIKNTLLNNFLNISQGYKMVGSVADLKMYNYAIRPNDVKQLYYGSDFSPILKNLKWQMPIGDRNYIEEISKWFKFKMPTHKTKFFNLNIHNLNVDDNLKQNIERAIGNIIQKLIPAHTKINKVNWVQNRLTNKNKPITSLSKKLTENSVYIGFGASANESLINNKYEIVDFIWYSKYETYELNEFLFNNLTYNSASKSFDSINLLDNDDIKVGNSIFNAPLYIFDREMGYPISWTCYFVIKTNQTITSDENRGDGFSFIIQNKNSPVTTNSLNNFTFGYNGTPNSIAIVFDTRKNDYDINKNHIEIDINGNIEKSIEINSSIPFDMNTGKFNVWIDYNGNDKILNVYMSQYNNANPTQNGQIKPDNPIIGTPLYIDQYLKPIEKTSQAFQGIQLSQLQLD